VTSSGQRHDSLAFEPLMGQLKIARHGPGRPRTRPGRVLGDKFDPAAYKQRNTVERAFGKLRQHRAVATRFDKRDFVWRGTVDVASIKIWLRDPVPRLNPRGQPAGQTA
jgi:hypothetical protein